MEKTIAIIGAGVAGLAVQLGKEGQARGFEFRHGTEG